MEVYANHDPNSPDPIAHLGFEKLAHLGAKNLDFYYGGHANNHIGVNTGNRKIFWSTEEQLWQNDTTHRYEPLVEKLLTICPSDRPKRQLTFFPFNEDYIPAKEDKLFDIVYSGSLAAHTDSWFDVITKFNYRFISFLNDGRVTNRNASYTDKLKIMAQSKMGVCHSGVSSLIGTQVKSRYFELAMAQTLILCLKDDYNVISQFFEPDKEFLYFENALDLEEKIRYILNNYGEFAPIVARAYTKCIENYTTRKFIEKYLI